MNGLSLRRGRLLVAPVGTSPASRDGWQEVSATDNVNYAPHLIERMLAVPQRLPARVTFTMPFRMTRCSWRVHRLVFGKPHPRQQQAKARYRQRARRRARGRR
ncbi:hypothetical protein ACIBKY_03615 [Nonomuraea sp. NPDC050394]|uniref:hypothetical protein n=1 Tax=Nonomuraea sp. NPDC050394 TaxID=3364363 RepID=UPI0037B5A3E7